MNGITVESVAIVHLDPTDKNALDPNNVFDAEGLKLITDATERPRKEKNEIQRNAERAIKDVETDIARCGEGPPDRGGAPVEGRGDRARGGGAGGARRPRGGG